MLRVFFALILMSLLAACDFSNPEDVMSPVKYTKPIKLHSQKVAYLNWQMGKAGTQSDPTFILPNDPISPFIVAAIDSSAREQNPGRYNYSFGKAQQAVFMTSLRDALISHHVFSKVYLGTNPSNKKADVVINVFFKATSVRPAYGDYMVTLDTVLSIKEDNKNIFNRNYFVQSNPESTKQKDYKGQQSDASLKLLQQMINGITVALK